MNYNIEKFLISIKKWISSIEEVIVDKFIDLENKLNNKTEKVRIDIVDTDNNGFAFKNGEDILNFKELNDLLQNSPDFLVFVYGKREHRCTMIDMDSNPRQMRFVAPMLSDNRLKTQSFYITSLDGVEITSIARTDINCENSSNKVTEITESNKNSNTYYPTVKAVSDKLDNKVDKETGKGLSTNDYTTTEKNKLSNIEEGAQVNVQSDWNATSGDALILNKPNIPTNTSDLINDNGFITKDVTDLTNYNNKTDIINIEYSISMALNQLNERLEMLENNSVTISQ